MNIQLLLNRLLTSTIVMFGEAASQSSHLLDIRAIPVTVAVPLSLLWYHCSSLRIFCISPSSNHPLLPVILTTILFIPVEAVVTLETPTSTLIPPATTTTLILPEGMVKNTKQYLPHVKTKKPGMTTRVLNVNRVHRGHEKYTQQEVENCAQAKNERHTKKRKRRLTVRGKEKVFFLLRSFLFRTLISGNRDFSLFSLLFAVRKRD